MSPLLDAGDVRAAWAHEGDMGGASRSSGVESEWAGRAASSRRRELRLDTGLGPGRPGASLTIIVDSFCPQ